MKLEDLGFSVREMNVLNRCGFFDTKDLKCPGAWEKIFNHKSCGLKTLKGIILVFSKYLQQCRHADNDKNYRTAIQKKYIEQSLKERLEDAILLIRQI